MDVGLKTTRHWHLQKCEEGSPLIAQLPGAEPVVLGVVEKVRPLSPSDSACAYLANHPGANGSGRAQDLSPVWGVGKFVQDAQGWKEKGRSLYLLHMDDEPVLVVCK